MTGPVDLDYLAHRAEREAVLAVMAADALVAAVHQELCGHYSRQFLRGLCDRREDDGRGECNATVTLSR